MQLRAIAHSRTGDKGDISNISVIAYDPEDYGLLEWHVTAERVKEHFADIARGEVTRYVLPGLGAIAARKFPVAPRDSTCRDGTSTASTSTTPPSRPTASTTP